MHLKQQTLLKHQRTGQMWHYCLFHANNQTAEHTIKILGNMLPILTRLKWFQTTSFPLAIYKERSKQIASYSETNFLLLLVFGCLLLSVICSRCTGGFIKTSLKNTEAVVMTLNNTGEGIVYIFRDFINHCLNLMLLGGVI